MRRSAEGALAAIAFLGSSCAINREIGGGPMRDRRKPAAARQRRHVARQMAGWAGGSPGPARQAGYALKHSPQQAFHFCQQIFPPWSSG